MVVAASYAALAISGGTRAARPRGDGRRAESSRPSPSRSPSGPAIGATDTDRHRQPDRLLAGADQANPQSDRQYVYLGDLYSQKGRETGDIADYALAADAFRKALALFPGRLRRQGRPGAATSVTLHQWKARASHEGTALLETDTTALGAVAIVGDASLEIGDLDTAQAGVRRAPASSPGSGCHRPLARLAFLHGEHRRRDSPRRRRGSRRQRQASAEEQAFDQYVAGEYRWNKGDIERRRAHYQAALHAVPVLLPRARGPRPRGIRRGRPRIARSASIGPRPRSSPSRSCSPTSATCIA